MSAHGDQNVQTVPIAINLAYVDLAFEPARIYTILDSQELIL